MEEGGGGVIEQWSTYWYFMPITWVPLSPNNVRKGCGHTCTTG